ncbi:MAG: hypothetical protein J3Q66DRAFT_337440 [Benniella sp.]|nr:MAG: hypothetical protein J3Q66DRAFT_337440 [Benniella sp.]
MNINTLSSPSLLYISQFNSQLLHFGLFLPLAPTSMYARSFVAILLLALCAIVLAHPPFPTDEFDIISPREGDVYRVGQKFTVIFKIVNGTESKFYKTNPQVDVRLQKNMRNPSVNVLLGTYPAQELHNRRFRYTVEPQYYRENQTGTPYRIRATFGYDDTGLYWVHSGLFQLVPKK